MYCTYRVEIQEYRPGQGWVDDGCLYSTDKLKLNAEVNRRITTCYCEQEKVRASDSKIVVVHETFLRDLKRTPVLSTMYGHHPADLGELADYNKKRRESCMTDTYVPPASFEYLNNTNSPSAVR